MNLQWVVPEWFRFKDCIKYNDELLEYKLHLCERVGTVTREQTGS